MQNAVRAVCKVHFLNNGFYKCKSVDFLDDTFKCNSKGFSEGKFPGMGIGIIKRLYKTFRYK